MRLARTRVRIQVGADRHAIGVKNNGGAVHDHGHMCPDTDRQRSRRVNDLLPGNAVHADVETQIAAGSFRRQDAVKVGVIAEIINALPGRAAGPFHPGHESLHPGQPRWKTDILIHPGKTEHTAASRIIGERRPTLKYPIEMAVGIVGAVLQRKIRRPAGRRIRGQQRRRYGALPVRHIGGSQDNNVIPATGSIGGYGKSAAAQTSHRAKHDVGEASSCAYSTCQVRLLAPSGTEAKSVAAPSEKLIASPGQ